MYEKNIIVSHPLNAYVEATQNFIYLWLDSDESPLLKHVEIRGVFSHLSIA